MFRLETIPRKAVISLMYIIGAVFCVITLLVCRDFVGRVVNIAALLIMNVLLTCAMNFRTAGVLPVRDAAEELELNVNRIREHEEEYCFYSVYSFLDVFRFENEELKSAFSDFSQNMTRIRAEKETYRSCDIADYIGEELFERIANCAYNDLLGGTLTGLGILGTFVGLTFGLSRFRNGSAAEMMETIPTLIEGIKVAFLTSIFGIVYSLLFNTFYRSVIRNAERDLLQFQQFFYEKILDRPDSGALSRLVGFQEQQQNDVRQLTQSAANIQPTLEELNRTLPDSVETAIRTGVLPSMEQVAAEFGNLSAQMKEDYTRNIDRAAKKFIGRFSDLMGTELSGFGEQVRQVGEVQGRISADLMRLSGQIAESTEQLARADDRFMRNADSYDALAARIIESQDRFCTRIETVLTDFAGMISLSEQHNQALEKTVEMAQNAAADTGVLRESAASIMAGWQSSISEERERLSSLYSEMISQLHTAQDTFSEHLLAQEETLHEAASEQRERLEKHENEQMNKLVDTFEQEARAVTRQMEHMSSVIRGNAEQLNTMQKTFVSDMRVVSAMLADAAGSLAAAGRNLAPNGSHESKNDQGGSAPSNQSGGVSRWRPFSTRSGGPR